VAALRRPEPPEDWCDLALSGRLRTSALINLDKRGKLNNVSGRL
jgi:hypothetical protein